MSRSFEQRIAASVADLLLSVAVSPEPGRTLVSQALYDAIREIEAEVTSNRTNWNLVAALTGVKSYIVTVEPSRTIGDPFWVEQRGEGEASVYAILDGLHHEVCHKLDRVPSGRTEFRDTPRGAVAVSGQVDASASPTSPTLRLIAEERARIEAGSARMLAEPRED